MFTFDPSPHVDNDADSRPVAELEMRARELDWAALEDSFEDCLARYAGKNQVVAEGFSIVPTTEEVYRALAKYGRAIIHTARMYRHLSQRCGDQPFEVELSVDETDTPTRPFEHYLVAAEMRRLGVKLISLAPRFVGDFEKGIDYKGNLELFKAEYRQHLAIASALGPYKLSIHSGSDKFSVYAAVASIGRGVHVKTAGTSYLEALRAISTVEPALFREILGFAIPLYETEKLSYHVSASLSRVPAPADCSDARLPELLGENDARQVLHVTFGKVLTSRDASGKHLFRERILKCLEEHEDAHYDCVEKHIRRHIAPFRQPA